MEKPPGICTGNTGIYNSSMIGGNGYLSVYLCGILLGNSYLPHKRDMVLFFDVLTGVAQMMIFFLLGLLVTPSQLPQVIIPSFVIMIFHYPGWPSCVCSRTFSWFSGIYRADGTGVLGGTSGCCFHCFCNLCSAAPGPFRI